MDKWEAATEVVKAGWIKSGLYIEGHGSCALGAIGIATMGSEFIRDAHYRGYPMIEYNTEAMDMVSKVAEVMREQYPEMAAIRKKSEGGMDDVDVLWMTNDNYMKTKEELIKVFEKASTL